MAAAGTAPGGTGTGRYVTLVSSQIPGAAARAESGQRKTADVVLWLRRDAGNKTQAQGHLPRLRGGGVPLAVGFPRHATRSAYPLIAVPASAPGSAGPARPACCP